MSTLASDDMADCIPPTTSGTITSASTSTHEIRITLSLPMSQSAFTKDKQAAFKASLAQAAGVASEAVVINKIESISSRRHLLAEAIRVETSIMAAGKAAAQELAGRLTADSINRELSKTGLPTATVLEAAKPALIPSTSSPSTTTSASTTECDKCCDTGCQRMNGDWVSCERGHTKAGIGCSSTCRCKCKWYYGGKCDSASQGCENLKDYQTNGRCHDENYMLTLAAQAVGTFIGVTLILIIVLPIVLVICICVFICFMLRRQTTIIVNQAVQPGTGVPRGTQSLSLQDRPPNSGMGSQSDQVPLETKDIQIRRAMQPGPDGMAGIGMSFVCVAESLEPAMVTELTPGQPAALSGKIYRNQQIVKINGQDVRGLETNQVVDLIKGTPGTMVTLTVMKPSTHRYVPEERYPLSITSPPELCMIDGSLVFDNLSSNRFRDFGGNPMADLMLSGTGYDRYGRPLGGGAAASHTYTSEVDMATINQIIANMDGVTATSTAGNMGDNDNDLRCHFLQNDISLEGVQKLRNAGVCRLSDFHYIPSSDVRNMNMSIIDQRKTVKMLESWHAMHQDVLRRPVRALEQQITPAAAANGTHRTLEDACDDLESPEIAFPF
jgi:hypothetical protein